jgi:ABC-type lipoprotein release transport system permease subunit
LLLGDCKDTRSPRLAGFIQSLPFSVGPVDPPILACVAPLFGVVAALACLVPPLRAPRIDPIEALRGG